MGDVERVGLFLTGLNDYQRRLQDDALTRNKDLGFSAAVQVAENDPSTQIAQLQLAIKESATSGMTAMLVSPVDERALKEVARAVLEAGIDWIFLTRGADYLENLRRGFPERVVFAVLPDQTEIGRIQGRLARALAPVGSQLLCITGRPDTWSAQRRLEGFNEVVGRTNPVAVINGNWTTEGARHAVAAWLAGEGRGKALGAFVAQNDDMALGVRQVIRPEDGQWFVPLADLPIIGCDGSSGFGQRLVLARHIAATVVVSSAVGPALTCLRRARTDRSRPPSQVVLPAVSFPEIEEIGPRSAP
jgi:ABC-type sugar transport system substrate-binding protein